LFSRLGAQLVSEGGGDFGDVNGNSQGYGKANHNPDNETEHADAVLPCAMKTCRTLTIVA
jgi:hypothetical protein